MGHARRVIRTYGNLDRSCRASGRRAGKGSPRRERRGRGFLAPAWSPATCLYASRKPSSSDTTRTCCSPTSAATLPKRFVRVERSSEDAGVCGDAQIRHQRQPSQAKDLRARGASFDEAAGALMTVARSVRRVEEHVHVDGVAHRGSASRTAKTASLSERSTRDFMSREVQRNNGAGRVERRRASASASSSETTAPIDRPSLS